MDQNQKPNSFMEELYREMYFPLLRYAVSILQQPTLAEEAVQETFAIAWSKVSEVSASPNPEGWLMVTLRHVLKNTQRRRAALSWLVVASLEYSGERITAAANDDHLDAEYGDLLSPEDYRLLKHVVLDRCSVKEAAEELDISLEACKKRIQRAKEKLRRTLLDIKSDPRTGDGGRTEGGAQNDR